MNSPIENIIVNSSQYTPVYIIKDPGVNQAGSIVVTTNPQKPISNTLKTFYENSGKLENNLLQSSETVSIPKAENIIKKPDINVIGNNLKLANFLLPKTEFKIDTSKQYISPVNNVLLKPVFVANTPNGPSVASTATAPSVSNTVPKLDVCSKIVKLKDLPNTHKHRNGKIVPKKKPKEDSISQSKTTSVQLLKLGETYHSLNELSDDQMKIVNHALKIFSNPKNTPKEPTYDPVTNTRFIYKVVSPKDLTVVGKNKVVIKQKKQEVRRETVKRQEKKETKLVPEIVAEPIPVETKVTRSGRKVKLPKNILPEEILQKPKKKTGTIASCFQCSSEFSSLYRLQRHYEHHPTHIPARIHSNLFHCLLAIIKTGSEEDRANIFLQQLEQVITKIKSLIPCLLKSDGVDGKLSTISEDVGRLFGINPGKYNLNIDALSCVKDKDGHCLHNPAPPPTKPAQTWTHENNEDTLKAPETDDCARINSAEKWPTVSKRMERKKPEQTSAKKIKLIDSEVPVELGDDDIAAFFSNTHKTETSSLDKTVTEEIDITNSQNNDRTNLDTPTTKPAHIKFHSTHFDIRSSPIKPTSTVFRKFQINPEKMPKFDIQEIQPLISQENEFTETVNTESNENTNIATDHLFIEDTVQPDTNCKDVSDLNFNSSKEWTIKYTDNEHSTESFLKPDSLITENTDYLKSNASIEPSLIHVKDLPKLVENEININELPISDHSLSNQGSVLNFLESLGSAELSYPDTTIRNHSVDFQLDLFSFSN